MKGYKYKQGAEFSMDENTENNNSKEVEKVVEEKQEENIEQNNEIIKKTVNKFCILSFIIAIIGLFSFALFCGGIAIILAIIGLVKYKNNAQIGKGFAIYAIALAVMEIIVLIYNYLYVNNLKG